MSVQQDNIGYPTVTVNNVYCENIRVNKCGPNDSYIATFTFSDSAGIHGLLLGEVKRQYRDTSYVLAEKCMSIPCDPSVIDKNTCVIGSRVSANDPAPDSRTHRRTRSTLSMVKLQDVAESRPTFSSRVNITFHSVSIFKQSSLKKDTWFVAYTSYDAESTMPMRCNA